MPCVSPLGFCYFSFTKGCECPSHRCMNHSWRSPNPFISSYQPEKHSVQYIPVQYTWFIYSGHFVFFGWESLMAKFTVFILKALKNIYIWILQLEPGFNLPSGGRRTEVFYWSKNHIHFEQKSHKSTTEWVLEALHHSVNVLFINC